MSTANFKPMKYGMPLVCGNLKSYEKMKEAYGREAAIYGLYKNAETEAEIDEAKNKMKQFEADTKAKALKYCNIYRRYVQAKNRGNRHINFDEVKSLAETVETLRKFGIDVFTFSSRWSGMIDDLAEFLKAGCQICGMVEIFSHHQKPFSD